MNTGVSVPVNSTWRTRRLLSAHALIAAALKFCSYAQSGQARNFRGALMILPVGYSQAVLRKRGTLTTHSNRTLARPRLRSGLHVFQNLVPSSNPPGASAFVLWVIRPRTEHQSHRFQSSLIRIRLSCDEIVLSRPLLRYEYI